MSDKTDKNAKVLFGKTIISDSKKEKKATKRFETAETEWITMNQKEP